MSLSVSIEKNYGDFVLKSSFECENGILGFLGPSGCGKTLTLKCIAGIETPDRGQIILNGVTLFDSEKRINLPANKRKVGYLFQNYALFPNMTVEQNILCGLHLVKDEKERRERVMQMMKRLKIADLAKHRPHQLSGGQQQRVALARILVGEPEILLLDEPFSALDSHLRLQMEGELTETLKEFQKNVILVSHDRNEIYRMCQNIAVMEDGKILNLGATKAVFQNPRSIRGAILTGCKNIVAAKKKGDFLVEVPEWNMELETKERVEDSLKAIGIRAHSFGMNKTENQGKICIRERVEEPFEWIVKFTYEGARKDAKDIWWRVSKENYEEQVMSLGVSPKDIMLLYEGNIE